ncbi:hypothetical protein DFP73DRAFT_57349 [Morchella snyderi]|nr:hypothetical protein DFP73DRAFT_57349 [Morchella snyderi]
MALWNADTVKDVSESVGIPSLADDVAKNLAMDVEYRLHQVLQEALKFMRHSKRTTLATTDISNALRVLDVEPLYGYESTRPLKYGEASLGQAQPIYYVEDDEVDFEKLINAPLPKMPREVTFTAHWLAIEGVQPAIPMNPTPSESARQSETTPKGAPPPPAPIGFSSSSSSSSAAAAAAGSNTATNSSGSTAPATADVAVRPLVKHILSKELQLYFDRVCSAVTDEANDALRAAALASLRNDPGLHQLLPYFVQWISERVTHGLKHLFVLSVMLQVTHALLENANLFIEPYVAALIPPILTCLIGKRLGGGGGAGDVYELRDLAASLLKAVCRRFGDSSHTLKPRLTRTCLKHFLDPAKPWGTHYGAIMGLAAVGGREAVRVLVLPNVKLFVEGVVKGAGDGGGGSEAERVVGAVVGVLRLLEEEEEAEGAAVKAEGEMMDDGARDRLVERVGETVADYVWRLGRPGLVKAIVEPLGVL